MLEMNQNALKSSLDYLRKWLEARYEKIDIPGFTVAVSCRGKVLFNQAYGLASVDRKEKLTPQHLFRIASHSKTFTATAIMQLQEAGSLDINDPVVKYLPWLAKHKDQRWQKVTIRQLLSHGAGVIRDGLDSNYWQFYHPFPDKNQFKRDILEASLVLEPEIKMKYSNFGYNLLGMVIEAASGQLYKNYVEKNIINAIGLKNTFPEYLDSIADKMATGYSRKDLDNRLPINNFNSRAETPAAGFCSTAEDLCKYFSAHIIGSGELLTDKSKREMQRKVWKVEGAEDKEEYGLGIKIDYEGDRRLIGHGGGFPGFITKSFFDPKDELAVVVLTNWNGGGAEKIARSIFKFIDYFQDLSLKEKAHDLKFIGRFMELFDYADFVAVGNKLVFIDLETWEPFESPQELERVNESTYKIVKAESTLAIGELVHLNFDESGKIESVIMLGQLFCQKRNTYRKFLEQKE